MAFLYTCSTSVALKHFCFHHLCIHNLCYSYKMWQMAETFCALFLYVAIFKIYT